MPVERRLRTGLARNADVIDPDVDRFFGAVARRGRRRVITHRVAAGLVVAAAVTAVIIAGPPAWHALGGLPRPAPVVQPTHKPGTPALSGTFRRTVSPGGVAVRSNHLAGRWTIRLRGGTIDAVSAPPAFTGLLSAFQYQVRGRQFRTNLFIQDVCANKPAGTYRWARSGRALRFTAVNDLCRARAALLASGPWQEKP